MQDALGRRGTARIPESGDMHSLIPIPLCRRSADVANAVNTDCSSCETMSAVLCIFAFHPAGYRLIGRCPAFLHNKKRISINQRRKIICYALVGWKIRTISFTSIWRNSRIISETRSVSRISNRRHSFPRASDGEGDVLKGKKRSALKLFIPDMLFDKHIEMGENVWVFIGETYPAYCIY